MKWIKFFCLFLLFSLLPFYIRAEHLIPLIGLPSEDAKSLYSYSSDAAEIEFFADGFWNIGLNQNVFLPFNTKQALKLDMPVFSQEIELSVWFLLNNSWYFEAAFAEGFEKNSIAAGYYGEGFIKHIRLANRGIHFSDLFSSMGLSKDENETPGIYAAFGKDNFQSEAFVRLESSTSHTRQFIGQANINGNLKEDREWLRGQFFTLPSEALTKKILAVYVEDEKGKYVSETFSKTAFRPLSENEFLVYPAQSLVYLTKKYEGILLFQFNAGSSEKDDIFSELGSYNDGSTEDTTSFLKKIQNEFTSIITGENLVELGDYAFAGKEENDKNFFVKLENKETGENLENLIMLVQHPSFFSPFENASYYSFITSSPEESFVYTQKTKEPSSLYRSILSTENSLFQFDTAEKNKSFVQVIVQNQEGAQFPFAKTNPNLYLQGKESKTESLYSIELISSDENTKASEYLIGSQALLGTIQVFINGIETKDFSYSKNNGKILLEREIRESDKVEISWKEETKGFENAAVKTAVGFNWDFAKLQTSLIFSGDYPIDSKKNFSEIDSIQAAHFESRASLDYKNETSFGLFSLEESLSFSLTNPNVSQILRLDGMNEESKSYYLSKEAVRKIENAGSIYLNLKDKDGSIGTSPEPLDSKNFYSADIEINTDEKITGYAWDLSLENIGTKKWTVVEIELDTQDLLSGAAFFSIALKNLNGTNEDFDIYLQLGESLERAGSEIYEKQIPTWKLTGNDSDKDPFVTKPFDFNSGKDWQTIRVALTNHDRSHLGQNPIARLIIVHTKDEEQTGSLRIGPYEISPDSFKPKNASSQSSDAQSFTFYAPNTGQKRIQEFNANAINTAQAFFWQDGETYQFKKNLPYLPLQSYKKLAFFYAIPEENIDLTDNEGLSKLALDFFQEGELSQNTKKVLSIHIDFEELEKLDGEFLSAQWHHLEIDLEEKILFIDGKKIDKTAYSIDSGESISPNSLEVSILGNEAPGSIYIDELYLSDPYMQSKLRNTFAANYKTDFSLKLYDFPILEQIQINLKTEQVYSKEKTWLANDDFFSAASELSTHFSLLSFDIKNLLSLHFTNSAEKNLSLDQFSYSIKSSPHLSLFKYLSLSENLLFSPLYQTSIKENSLFLQVPKAIPPLDIQLGGKTKASFDGKNAKQMATIENSYFLSLEKIKLSLEGKLNLSQKTEGAFINDFSENYKNSFDLQFSNGEKAKERNEEIHFKTIAGIDYLSLKPELSFKNKFLSLPSENKSRFQPEIQFSLPFKIQDIDFSFQHKKYFRVQEKDFISLNYEEDLEGYFQRLSEAKTFYTSLLFFDLFPSYINANDIWHNRTKGNLENQELSTSYGFQVKRKLYLNPMDIIVPASFDFSLERNIFVLDQIQSKDNLYYLTKLSYTSFNNFGLFGSKKLFSWFEQDELFSSLQCKIKHNLDSNNVAYAIRFFEQVNIYISEDNTLFENLDMSFDSEKKLSLYFSVSWHRKGKNSFLKPLIESLMKSEDEIFLLRKNNLSYLFEKNTEILNTLHGDHEIEIQPNKNLSFITSLNGNIIFTEKKMKSLELDLSLSAKLKF